MTIFRQKQRRPQAVRLRSAWARCIGGRYPHVKR